MFIFTLVSKHPISACVFITIKGHHCVQIFPLLVNAFQYRNRFNVSITHCVILVTRTGSILPQTEIRGVPVPMCSHDGYGESQLRGWSTVNSLVVTLFHIITRTGTDLIFLSRLGSTICFTNFGSHDPIVLYWNPWYTEPCYKGSLLYIYIFPVFISIKLLQYDQKVISMCSYVFYKIAKSFMQFYLMVPKTKKKWEEKNATIQLSIESAWYYGLTTQ